MSSSDPPIASASAGAPRPRLLPDASSLLRADAAMVCAAVSGTDGGDGPDGGGLGRPGGAGGLAGVDDVALGVVIDDLAAAIERLETSMAFAVAAAEARTVPALDGALSTRGWVRHRQAVTTAVAGRRVGWARFVRRHRLTADALAAGRISVAHLEVIDGAVLSDLHGVYAEHEPAIVEAAERLSPEDLRRVMAHWRQLADQDRADGETRRGHTRRGFGGALGLDGFVRLWGSLDAEAWATLCAVLDDLHPPDAPDGITPPRSQGQRRADALAELADLYNHRHLDGADDERADDERADDGADAADAAATPDRTRAPHVSITGVFDLGLLGGGPVDLRSVRCGIEGLGPAARATLERMCCDSPIARAVLATPSCPLDVGYTKRFFTDAQRRALALRDGGCVFPGCDRPADWCVAHHITAWPEGPTDLDNGCLLCRRHHTLVHEGGWTIWLVDGVCHVEPPSPRRRHLPRSHRSRAGPSG